MAAPASPRLSIIRQDDLGVLLDLDSDSAGTALNITGRTYVMSVGSPGAVVATVAGTVDGAAGEVLFEFDRADLVTALLENQYSWDVVQTTNGKEATLIKSVASVDSRVTPYTEA